jgi:LacI family transcriptional regulator
MADVAERAGVSKSTVSLVLNNRPSVSPKLRRAVLKAAEELGYHPPDRRSQKRPPENRSIIVVHYEVGTHALQTPSIFLDYVAGIQAFAHEQHVNLTFITDYREERQQLGFHLLSKENLPTDGAILMGWGARRDGELLRRFLDKRLPLVVLSRNWPDLPISTVGQDHHQQARIALEYLIGLGHVQIAFLASEEDRCHEWFDWRLACYRKAMLRVNEHVDEELVAVGQNGYEAAQALMARRPDVTAIFAVEDANALAAVRGLHEIGLRVPTDVSVIGLDDTASPPEGYPALTTVAFPHYEVGYLAAELLLKQIESAELYYSNVVVRSNLVERDSCAPPRGGDHLTNL